MMFQGDNDLPEGWASAPFGEILPLQYGKALGAASRNGAGEVPVYGSSGIVGYHDESYAKEPAIIVGRKGNVGAVYFSALPSWPIDTAYFGTGSRATHLPFYRYLLEFLDLVSLDKSTAVPGLSRTDYEKVVGVVAPLSEQVRIAQSIEEYLSRLDATSTLLDHVQRNLRRYRASVLKAAVEGRLVPTEAELARAEKRDYEPASVLLKRILAERRRRWEAEGKRGKYEEPEPPETKSLPDLPKGWCWASVEQICSAIVDCPHSTPKWTPAGRVCVRTTEFLPGRLDMTDVRYVSDTTYSERIQRLRPMVGDVLYSREGGILGIACRIPDGVELCMGQRMMLMRPAQEGLSEFLMHVLNSPLILDRVRRLTGGSASPHLNVGDVRQFPVPLPPLGEAQRILEKLSDLQSIAHANEGTVSVSIKRCVRLRQSILKWAFEGKLVDQDPKDEPASALLARIKGEKTVTPSKASAALRRTAKRKP